MLKLSMKSLPSLFALGLLVVGCSDNNAPKAPQGGPPAPQVTVAKPTQQEITDYEETTGRFVAVDAVEIRARVSGYLDTIAFKDGQFVDKGQLLFVIDQRPFKAALDVAKADLARAKAGRELAESELERAQALIKQKTISESVYDQRLQAKRSAEAQLQSAEAALRRAELDMEFTELRAPVAGRIGDRRVSPGNLVTGGTQGGSTTLLATIVSQDPIRFEFAADEASFLRAVRAGRLGEGSRTKVELKLIDEANWSHSGEIDFVDNVFDEKSGTIRGRAVFGNAKGLFTPGLFGKLRVPASAPYATLVIPEAAVVSDQARRIVFVLGPENVAQPRPIELGTQLAGGLRVVRKGLTPDDQVIVNGLMRVRPGVKVNPVPPAAPGAPAGGPPSQGK